MARELVQNADDAGATRIRFDIEEECLRVWNDEAFSTCGLDEPHCPWAIHGRPGDGARRACDFHAISSVGSGNKYQDASLIGRFGIGFVSVYQVTDGPIIRSSGSELRLDPLRERNRALPIALDQGSEFEFPWAFDPASPMREALSASAIGRSDLEAVERDLVSVANDCLLFLKHLEVIEVARDGKAVKRVERETLGTNRIRLSFLPEDRREEWYVIHASAAEAARPLRERYPAIERLGRQTELQIAFDLNGVGDRMALLFAYLPTEQWSPLPCHINADFFPEQNRRALVLSGEQHERYWNEMLLGVAAEEISRHLLSLRDVLGPERLWTLIDAALQYRESPHFWQFWVAIAEVAADAEVFWTAGEEWVGADACRIPPRDTTERDERSLSHISLDPVHRCLRQFQNTLQALGVKRLTLPAIVDALEEWDAERLDQDLETGSDALDEIVRPLWRVTNALMRSEATSSGMDESVVDRLRGIRFVPEAGAALRPIDDLYRLPAPMTIARIRGNFDDLPLVEEGFAEFGALYDRIDVLSFEALLDEIAGKVTDRESAWAFLGSDATRIRRFYRFLSDYPRPDGIADVAAISNAPILAGHDGFLSPSEAVLPGGFRDPTGRFDILDSTYYDDRARDFLTEVLGVRTLTLHAYVHDHLANILASGLSRDEYAALFAELMAHGELLEDDETRDVLSELKLVKTMDGSMRRAGECYFRSPELVELLGEHESLWVDASAFPAHQRELAKAFLTSLGMRSRPSLTHALDRIDAIVADPPSDGARDAIANLLQFVYQVFEEDDLSGREFEFADEIERLRSMEWLPASEDGVLQTDSWYAPHELYQPFRALGFDSQVPVLAIRPRSLTGNFLDFLEMPSEPDTSMIVDHLVDCVEHGRQPSEVTYQILSERLREEDDIPSLETLRDRPCIYAPRLERYLRTERIFWSRPPIPRYRFQASEWMHRHRELFDFLGVREEPDGSTYAGALREIAQEYGERSDGVPGNVRLIHATCMEALARATRDDPSAARDVLGDLLEHPFLVTRAGTLAF